MGWRTHKNTPISFLFTHEIYIGEFNMDLDKIFKLIDAGFSKDEIMKLSEVQTKGEPVETKAEPVETKTESTQDKVISDLTSQVTNLTNIIKDIQANNAKSAESEPPKKATAEDAIKSFFTK